MSDVNKNPSNLYDDDFIKKKKNEKEPKNFSDEDIFKEKEAFSSKGKKKEKADSKEENIDDINALLKSVGIAPIAEEKEPKKQEDIEKTIKISNEEKTEVIPDDGKTKHFDLKGKAPEIKKVQKRKDEGAQLILDGYGDEVRPKTVSQESVEKQLKKTRQNLIENFRVLSKEINDETILEKEPTGEGGKSVADLFEPKKGENLFDAIDKADIRKKGKNGLLKLGERTMRSVQQRAKLEKRREEIKNAKNERLSLKEELTHEKRKIEIFGVLLIVSLAFFFVLCSHVSSGAFSAFFANGSVLYLVLNLVLFAAGAVTAKDTLKNGFYSVIKFSPCPAFFAALSGCVSFLQCVTLFFLKPEDVSGYALYFPVFFFILLSQSVSEYLRLEGVRRDLSVLMRSKTLSTLQTVENKADASSLGYGISEKNDPKILYTADCEIPKDFEKFSLSRSTDEKLLLFEGISVLAASAAFSVAVAIISKSAAMFFAGFASSFCLCVPAMSTLVSSLIKLQNDKALSQSSAVVASFENAKEVAKSNAIVVDADEIFEGKVSKFRAVGRSMLLSDVVVFAASALKDTRSVIRHEFDAFLEEERIRPPKAEDVQYEEKLGYSCWIVGRRVLVGNRSMLVSHSIAAPTEEQETAFAKGKNVMYVVVEGIIVGVFAVDYRVKSNVKKSVSSFNKTGIVLMLNCGDPCLTQELAAKKLMADVAAIKLMTTKNCEIIASYKANASMRKENGLACSKSDKNILLLINKAHDLFEADRLSKIVLLSGLGFSFLLSAICAALKVSLAFSPLVLIVLQLVWGVIAFVIGKTRIKY